MTTLPGISTNSGLDAPKIKKPRRHLIRMVIFLAIVAGIAAFLFQPARSAFEANPYLNGLILAVLLFGIVFIFRQVFMLNAEIDWTENLKRNESGISLQSGPNLLSPLATIIRDSNGPLRMTAITMNTILDSISARLDEGRDISRYLINVLVFLGLLGTFWGLLETVGSVGDAITTLNVGSSDFSKVFDELKVGLEKPLAGMAVAFSSSLFGLSGSLILGFLDMQAAQSQNRFYTDLEEWLTSVTKFTTAGPAAISDGEQSVPAYVSALLEQTAESLDSLQRTLSRNEERRHSGESAMISVSEKLAALTDQMRAEQDLMVKLVEGQMELKPVLQRMAQVQEQGGLDQASRNHLRNLDVYLARLLEDVADGRNQVIQEIRSDIKLLTRTIATIAEEDRRK
ncbi:MotA/TolQ/ExbB proton channel family protein [Sneathiella glossodoripedis]|uniref:MotA/TolQ/ExbB proton channel family protein n=1 Tax=Sneathiella glossodoripedis TaxID=418853 RepID=UPI0006853ED6|nr:MotA/TolQ/ExbB proton channel family protein [Sneathiella glossodoripedis]